jgi:ubiquinone/menaquinone biosynthesis C-methylase UbiE
MHSITIGDERMQLKNGIKLVCPHDRFKLDKIGANKIRCEHCGRDYSFENNSYFFLPEKTVDNNLENESYEYWNGGIPGTLEYGYQKDDVNAIINSKKWFLEGDEFRYRQYSNLERFADFPSFSGKSLLDIGPGRGQESHNYAKHGANVTVLEYVEQGVRIAETRRDIFKFDFPIIQGTATDLPFQDNTFDAVFSYGVLHHIPDMKKALTEVERVLKEGGIAKIMLYKKGYFYYVIMLIQWYLLKLKFIKYSWKDYVKIAMEQREGPCPVVYIQSMKEILELVKDSNLKVEQYFNAEVIDGRLVRMGIVPKWFIKRFQNYLGAYCHLTLKKS